MNICVDCDASSRLAKFFAKDDEERWICIPSLNLGTLSTPGNEDTPVHPDYSAGMTLSVGSGKLRILTDISNNVDWKILRQLVATKNIEVRHCRCIDMNLFLLPQKQYGMVLVKEYSGGYWKGYFEDEIVLFESDAYDEQKSSRLFSMFVELWEWAETITLQKLEMFLTLAQKFPNFSLSEDEVPAGTYLLLSSKADEACYHGVFCSRLKDELSSLEETVSFPYIMGLDIPKDAKYIVHCDWIAESKRLVVNWIYAVDTSSQLDFDDFLWEHVDGKNGEFVVVRPNYIDDDVSIYPTRTFHFESPFPKMGARKIFMLSEVRCRKRDEKRLETLLNRKFKMENGFKDCLLNKPYRGTQCSSI